jgi:hypothetical protein
MNSRTWRAGALGLSIAVIVLLATQSAAGEPSRLEAASLGRLLPRRYDPVETSRGFGIRRPDALGSAFVVVAQQLRPADVTIDSFRSASH